MMTAVPRLSSTLRRGVDTLAILGTNFVRAASVILAAMPAHGAKCGAIAALLPVRLVEGVADGAQVESRCVVL
jgi:hypothetical protein